ncbi:Regulatory SIR2 [Hyphodiscus hymeniophilus]|uniref:Regulatory SIR2 n=1 Tax=Hyphodiscus hymeniophilus TaxID=353542 RepID=A0A9P7AY04_9HELO|nr:Regulatory SIR2 [Hyphodiscus hymeniophilus]
MGQENSMIDPETPPVTLGARSLEAVAEYIKKEKAQNVVVMTGAGISTSAGIPDFRSPETGLYANLARLELPYAEAVFSIDYFRTNPNPFYVLAKELYPGQFQPTVAHAFIALLHKKGLLKMLFTQNIDCLERRAGVPGSQIVEAHGSFATQRCIDCKTEYPDDLMKKAVLEGEVPHCLVPQCNGLVKPDIVFFGEALPEAFFQNRHVPAMADLVIVMGTSLSVQPFASLPLAVMEGVPRVLFNLETVGDLGSRADDVIELGDCDSGVRKLADALGWREELEALWMEVGGKVKEEEAAILLEQRKNMTKDELLEAEIEKLTGEVDMALKMSQDHTDRVNSMLDTDSTKAQPSSTPLISTSETSKIESNIEGRPASVQLTKEPPAINERLQNEHPVVASSVDTKADLNVTLPQNMLEKANTDSKI